jgi:hypothetical protein
MSNPEKAPLPEKEGVQFDSLNMDIVEPTDVIVDNTVRPMRDSLRKWLKLPPTTSSRILHRKSPRLALLNSYTARRAKLMAAVNPLIQD